MDDKSSYRSIFKAFSIFGGVQIFNILINLVRSKIVALILGPVGLGILGLFNATIGLISSVTNFGLGTSAVREVAAANESEDFKKLQVIAAVFQKLVWATGLLGMIVTIIFAPLISKITFGNSKYTFSFILISVVLLLNQLNSGQNVVLQGTRKLKWLALATIFSSTFSLLITLPLYYLYREKGILPAIILNSIVVLLVTSFFSNKIKIQKIAVSLLETKKEGKDMLKIGFMFSISGIITVLCSYLVRIFISHYGNVSEVGLYSAGFTILGTYVGMVFGAMSTDYYPRLCAVSHNIKKASKIINEQAEITILVLGPMLVSFIIFEKFIVILLYSQKFLPITDMLLWGALGMYFKAGSWSMAYLILAKGNSKLFFWNELVANIYIFILNILGYYFLGFKGLGISFLLGYFLYFLQILLFSAKKFQVFFNYEFIKIYTIMLIFGFFSFMCSILFTGWVYYSIGSLLLTISLLISLYLLNKKINFLSKFKRA